MAEQAQGQQPSAQYQLPSTQFLPEQEQLQGHSQVPGDPSQAQGQGQPGQSHGQDQGLDLGLHQQHLQGLHQFLPEHHTAEQLSQAMVFHSPALQQGSEGDGQGSVLTQHSTVHPPLPQRIMAPPELGPPSQNA